MKSPDSSPNFASKLVPQSRYQNVFGNHSHHFSAIALASSLATCLTLTTGAMTMGAIAGNLPERNLWGKPTCDVSGAEISRKHELRKAALLGQGSQRQVQAQQEYQEIVQKHKAALQACRDRANLATQATWLRLYANDTKAGVLEDVFDRIANRGYNQVFVEVFYDGRVLLPVADNPTPWRSVLEEAVKAGTVPANYDLWQRAVELGKARGIKVYGWSFAMNFGYGYSEVRGKGSALAINGQGENSIANTNFDRQKVANGRAFYEDAYEVDHLFVDPYSPIARKDLLSAVRALIARNPDGMVFDYVRYPTNANGTPIDSVKQLWIYGQASRAALLNRIGDRSVRELMALYLQNGKISAQDVIDTENKMAATLKVTPTPIKNPQQLAAIAQEQMWNLAANHAYRGVLDFLNVTTEPVKQQNIPIGTAFFPNGNYAEAGKFNPKMQPWDRFPSRMERHPMTYAICDDGQCVAEQVAAVIRQSAPETVVCPVLAGTWGQSFGGHPSLEIQTQAVMARNPQIKCLSHFVYSWMEPDSDRLRKAGQATGLEPITLP